MTQNEIILLKMRIRIFVKAYITQILGTLIFIGAAVFAELLSIREPNLNLLQEQENVETNENSENICKNLPIRPFQNLNK